MSNDGKDAEGKVVEAQTSYWANDPRNLQVYVKVTVHQVCFDKVKVVSPDFHKPAESDFADKKYPSIDKNGTVSLKTAVQFVGSKII